MSITTNKKILIVDEAGFSRICSAILEKEGHATSVITDVHQVDANINQGEIGLVITSLPYGALIFDQLKEKRIPVIILFDHMNRDLMSAFELLEKSLFQCMVKPLDYDKFRRMVNETMRGYVNTSNIRMESGDGRVAGQF